MMRPNIGNEMARSWIEDELCRAERRRRWTRRRERDGELSRGALG